MKKLEWGEILSIFFILAIGITISFIFQDEPQKINAEDHKFIEKEKERCEKLRGGVTEQLFIQAEKNCLIELNKRIIKTELCFKDL